MAKPEKPIILLRALTFRRRFPGMPDRSVREAPLIPRRLYRGGVEGRKRRASKEGHQAPITAGGLEKAVLPSDAVMPELGLFVLGAGTNSESAPPHAAQDCCPPKSPLDLPFAKIQPRRACGSGLFDPQAHATAGRTTRPNSRP